MKKKIFSFCIVVSILAGACNSEYGTELSEQTITPPDPILQYDPPVRAGFKTVAWSMVNDIDAHERAAAAIAIALYRDAIYIAGYDSHCSGKKGWRVEKRNMGDGSLDLAFGGGDGVVQSCPGAWWVDTWINAVAVNETGIYVAGVDTSPWEGYGWRVEKLDLTDGGSIWTHRYNPDTGQAYTDEPKGVSVDGTGVYVAGYDHYGNRRWHMRKLDVNNGATIWERSGDHSNSSDQATAVSVDETGMYVVGWISRNGTTEWRVEKRDVKNGDLLWEKDGVSGYPSAMTVDTEGVYVTGRGYSPERKWIIEKRNKYTGDVVWENYFGDTPDSIGRSMTADGDGVYIAGSDISHNTATPSMQWRVEKRSPADGSTLWAETADFSSGDDTVYSMVIDDDIGIYFAGESDDSHGSLWRVEKLFKE
ncbi:MAG: hypothetical protein AAB581_03035 [Patescibacteria group bacterium]